MIISENPTKDTFEPSNKNLLENPSYFLNRELSWLKFNERVLEEAYDVQHPLLERVKFIAISGSNLDEFFMTRIPRLLKKIKRNSQEKSLDGRTSIEQIQATRQEIIPLITKHNNCWVQEIIPALARERIYIRKFEDLNVEEKKDFRKYVQDNFSPNNFEEGFNPNKIENLHVYLIIQRAKTHSYCMMRIPVEKYGRLIRISKKNEEQLSFVLLEDLISSNLDLIFPNEKDLVAYPFRLTRNAEIEMAMNVSSNFLEAIQKGLIDRKTGFPTRLEFEGKTPQLIKSSITSSFNLPEYLIYDSDEPLGLADFFQLLKINRPDLKDQPFTPFVLPKSTLKNYSMMATIAQQDFLLYHPYDGFDMFLDYLKEAALDPKVTDIFITIYRIEHGSPVIETLIEAAKLGKKVTASVELKAKFDEEHNIHLISKLAKNGVNVVYNYPNIKVHAKLCLIARKDEKGTMRFSHIGSGNYNAVTSKIYADIGYLTSNTEIGEEVETLFNLLATGKQEKEFKHLLVAPKSLKPEILKRINREIEIHRKTGKGYIAFKLNHLEEKEIIQALYRASMEGIKIDLNVRGLCCLRPGVKGISDNISVISIVGRFLEHTRIFYFENGGEGEVLIGSSDLMIRNLLERIEVLLSVPNPKIRDALVEDILKIHLKDNAKARQLLPDGSYQHIMPKGESLNSQAWLIQNRGIWHEQPR